MSKTYKVGIAAMVHQHVWNELPHWMAMPNVEVVAAADKNEPLRAKALNAGVKRVYESLDEMLEKEDLDIVQAASENNVCAEIVEACAARGIHVISEKPMAATMAQADRMLEAATKANIKLMINWPSAWVPSFREWERRILAGDIGRVTYVKYRSAHNGPKEIGCDPFFYEWLYDQEKNGGGAFMDYCCYAANMNARFLGLPTEVTGMRAVMAKDYPLPDDNAIVIMKYPHSFGVAEASWTQVAKLSVFTNPEAHGLEGSIAVCDGKVLLARPGKELEVITPPALEAPARNGPEYLIHCIETGEEIEGFCCPKVSRDTQEILEAGLRAADTGQTQTLPLPK